MRKLFIVFAALAFAGCQSASDDAAQSAADAASEESSGHSTADQLAAVLEAQPEDMQARYPYRNPQETLEFFGIEPGMVVVEGLPGGGWYSKLLVPYLGDEGSLIVIDYQMEMWPLFSFGTPEFIDGRSTWTTDWPAQAEEWRGGTGAEITAYVFGSVSDEHAGTVDVVFFPRVLHNLARFENADGAEFLTTALADVHTLLKPGGTFGVVQHEARADMSDEFANGSNGYLKKEWLIERIEAAGFEFVEETAINENPADQPTEEDIVWRLPPSLATSREDDELRAQYQAIGESNRMTLRFIKPAG